MGALFYGLVLFRYVCSSHLSILVLQYSYSHILCLRQTSTHVAMKIVRSEPNYSSAALDEIQLMKCISKGDPNCEKPVCHLLDTFNIVGPYGRRLFSSNFTLLRHLNYRCLHGSGITRTKPFEIN